MFGNFEEGAARKIILDLVLRTFVFFMGDNLIEISIAVALPLIAV